MTPLLIRGVMATLSLSLLLTLLQLLRLGPVLIDAGPAATDLIGAALLALPALATIACSAGFLIATVITARDARERGTFFVLRLMGYRPHVLLHAPLKVAALVCMVNALFVLYLGPYGLEMLAGEMAEIYSVSRIEARRGAPIRMSDEVVVAANSATPAEDTIRLEGLWCVVDKKDGPTMLIKARAAEITHRALIFEDASVHIEPNDAPGGEPPLAIEVRKKITVELGGDGGLDPRQPAGVASWMRYVPALERATSLALITRAATEPRARRALAKRVALVMAPLLFMLVGWLGVRPELPTSSIPRGAPALLAVVAAVAYFGLLRLGELFADASGLDVLPALLPIGVAASVLSALVIRSWRRW